MDLKRRAVYTFSRSATQPEPLLFQVNGDVNTIQQWIEVSLNSNSSFLEGKMGTDFFTTFMGFFFMEFWNFRNDNLFRELRNMLDAVRMFNSQVD